MKIEILRSHGYPSLIGVKFPIIVEAKFAYEGCYDVYAEEFRAHTDSERMPESNDGRGLSHSFYSEGSFRVVNQGDSK